MASPRVTWFIWILNSAIGALIGAMFAVYITVRAQTPAARWRYRYYSDTWLHDFFRPWDVTTFTCGSALLGASLVSYFGERLLFGPGTLAFSNSPPSTPLTRALSIGAGVLGTLLILYAVLVA